MMHAALPTRGADESSAKQPWADNQSRNRQNGEANPEID